jgi:hypothetical protein
MQVEPHYLECVAFLCGYQRNKKGLYEWRAGGTAFFVRIPDERRQGRDWVYVVTARHCIEDSPKGPDGELMLRVPTVIGTSTSFKDFPTRWNDWHRHPDADVAVMLFMTNEEPTLRIFTMPPAFIDRHYRFTPTIDAYGASTIKTFKEQVRAESIRVALGHELFFPGLFVESAGNKRLLPVVRFGNIARLPSEEPISVESRYRKEIVGIQAYIVECHSLGGFSGSPVVWHYVINAKSKVAGQDVISDRIFFRSLLGLVSGHFDVGAERSEGIFGDVPRINSEFAIVTPAEYIRYMLLEDEMVVQERKEKSEMYDDDSVATADFAQSNDKEQLTLAPNPKDRIKIPVITRGQFFNDLEKATRKREKK